MAGITQKKLCGFISIVVPQKSFFWGLNKCESIETNEKFKVLIRSHVSMMAIVTIIAISVTTKMKNSNSNNSDY